MVERNHPIQTLYLIRAHLPSNNCLPRIRNAINTQEVTTRKRGTRTRRRLLKHKRLVVPIHRQLPILHQLLVLLLLGFTMPGAGFANGTEKISTRSNTATKRAPHVAFLRPRPLGLGCASIRAAYSGSRARCGAIINQYSQYNTKITTRLGRGEGRGTPPHLDIHEVFEQFRLSEEIRVSLDRVVDLGRVNKLSPPPRVRKQAPITVRTLALSISWRFWCNFPSAASFSSFILRLTSRFAWAVIAG